MACRERRRRPRQSLATLDPHRHRHQTTQRTTLNILPDPVRLTLPVAPPPPRPFDLEYDAASPETVQAAGPAPASYGSTVQFSTVQQSNLTRGGAHAHAHVHVHAPLLVGRQPCDRQMTSKLFRPILAVNHLSKGLANVLAALAGHWQLCLSSFLGSPDVKKLRSASSFQGKLACHVLWLRHVKPAAETLNMSREPLFPEQHLETKFACLSITSKSGWRKALTVLVQDLSVRFHLIFEDIPK